MRLRTLLTTVVAAVALSATPSLAGTFKIKHCTAKQAPKVELACATRNMYHADFTLLWVKDERRRTLQVVPVSPAKLLHLHNMRRNMLWLDRVSRSRRAEAKYRLYLSSFPPHHQLWMCIHNGEAGDWHNRDTGGNGHYGGMQMHPGWGYGTSYYASDDSQLEQEWAAERGYAASHYSSSFLWQQWGADAGCF